MKSVRNLSLLALALAAGAPAFATYCPAGTVNAGKAEPFWPDRCNEGASPQGSKASSTSTSGALAAALAGAGAQSDADAVGVKGNVSPTATGIKGDVSPSATATGVKGDISASAEGGRGGSARQGQGQQQGQGQTLRNRTDSTSGVTIEGNQAGSGDSYRSTFTAWAPVTLGSGAAAVPTALMAPIVRKCGPRVYLENVPVMGQVIGPFGGLSQVKLGERTVVNPAEAIGAESFLIENVYEETVLPNGYRVREIVGQRMIGHEIAGYAAVLTTSSAQSFSLGAFSGGNGAQGGAAGSAGMQQQNQLLNAFDCVYSERFVVKVEITMHAKPAPTVAAPKPRPPVKRRAAPKPCPVCCVPVAAMSCPAPAAK